METVSPSTYNPFALTGKTILVTGASSGIGQATAIACSRLGAKLVITGRSPERLQTTFDRLEGSVHQQILAELTSDEALANLVDACPELNGLVLCAGVNCTLPLKFATKDKFAEILDVNFMAPVDCLRRLLEKRKLVNAASVVFVSSIAGTPQGSAPGNAVYGASKAALDAVMRSFVLEYSARKIRFNSVNPAMVNTPLVERMKKYVLTPEQVAANLKSYPLGRYGEVDDIAHGIIYLLSDASSWVTGHQLVIDGGATI